VKFICVACVVQYALRFIFKHNCNIFLTCISIQPVTEGAKYQHYNGPVMEAHPVLSGGSGEIVVSEHGRTSGNIATYQLTVLGSNPHNQ
jgi:hypothetical protein